MGLRYFSEKYVLLREQLITRIMVTEAQKFDRTWAFP